MNRFRPSAVRRLVILTAAAFLAASPLGAQVTAGPAGVTINLADTDMRAAVQSLARYLDHPVTFGQIAGGRVTLQTPRPVPASQVPSLLRSMLEANGHELVLEGDIYRVQQKGAGAARPGGAPAAGGFGSPFAAPQPTPFPGAGQPTMQGGGQLFVIRLRHARAADVAATVNALYGRASAIGELGARPGTLNDQLRQNLIPPGGGMDPAAAQAAARSGSLAGDLVMVPDERTNSLLVRSTGQDFQLIQEAVRQLDIRPLQVLIEVVIAEVRRNSTFRLGLSSSLDSTRVPGTGVTVVGGNAGLSNLGGFILRVMGIGGDENVNVVLAAAAGRGDATIVSRPVVLAANNEAAEVMVGDQVPFVQLQRTLPTDNGVRDQVVQYKDVGTQLNVRPTISADGYVMLEVVQELNDVNTGIEVGGVSAPVISTRSVQTRLLVRDGQTAVLGGLARRRRERSRGGVPILSSIPLIGWVFGSASRDSDDTELFVFLTPRVIRDDEEMDSTTATVRERAPRMNGAMEKVPSVAAPPPAPVQSPAPAPAPQQAPAPPPSPSSPTE